MNTVIFDMDGVLFDTERLCRDSWLAVAQEEGLTGMEQVFPRCIGLNGNDCRQVVLSAYGQNFDYDGFRQRASAWFEQSIAEKGLPIKAGARELLVWLEENRWNIGLASSTRRSRVLAHLEEAGISRYFSVVITGDMVEHSKPQPDIYLIACEKTGAEPDQAYAIEDSPNGIRSAYAAGMMPLMVPDMIAPDEEMIRLSRKIFHNLCEVQRFFADDGQHSGSIVSVP